MKVQFVKHWAVKQGDGKGPVYKPGDVADLERSYAEKYKRRGLAVDYVEPKPEPVKEVVEPPKPRVSDFAPVNLKISDVASKEPARRK